MWTNNGSTLRGANKLLKFLKNEIIDKLFTHELNTYIHLIVCKQIIDVK